MQVYEKNIALAEVYCVGSFYKQKRDISPAVHGNDFTFCGVEEDLMWMK